MPDTPRGSAARRRACRRKGHRFAEIEGVNLPVIFCRRWFCKASIPAPWVPEPLRSALAKECADHA